MKDSQGTNIINPETMKIIRNLRQKALHENKGRDYYVNLMVNSLKLKHPGRTNMTLTEDYGQQWCIEHGIIGYEYIVNCTVGAEHED